MVGILCAVVYLFHCQERVVRSSSVMGNWAKPAHLVCEEIVMKNVIVSLVALAGIAAVAAAQNGTTLRWEVRQLGTDAWSTNLNVLPGSTVEFRALSTYTGSIPAFGISALVFQPTVSNWNSATDTLLPFRNVGTSPATGGVVAGSGNYGRIIPFAVAGISTTNALRGHTNLVAGINYLRVAQNNTTNWVGVGATSGTAGANNTNGAGGIALGNKPFGQVNPLVDPPYSQETQNVEVLRLAITLGGTADRTLTVDAPLPGHRAVNGVRSVNWHASATDNIGLVTGAVTIETALINVVPTPGALALLGLGGLVTARRRR